jgi:hypothetical protein
MEEFMHSPKEHHWKESDDVVALYLSKYGDSGLGLAISDVAARLNIAIGAMKMRMSNFKSQSGSGGLANASRQTGEVYGTFHDTPEPELRSMVCGILMRAKDIG